MLGNWRSMEDYHSFVQKEIVYYATINPEGIIEYWSSIEKLWIFDTDRIQYITQTCYSHTGRPAENQPKLYRAYILMQDIDLPITLFHKKLHRNPILCIVCGFSINDIPCIGAFYNFVDRLIAMDDKSRLKVFRKKPTKKYGKGEKMPPKHDGVVERLVNKAIIGRSFLNRPERILQQAFATVVKQSAFLGLIDNNIIASGDGTCILTGASSRGKKVCE